LYYVSVCFFSIVWIVVHTHMKKAQVDEEDGLLLLLT